MIASILALVVALGCICVAALAAAADAALLTSHAGRSTNTDAEETRNERERIHRALAMLRVMVYLAGGAGLANFVRFAVFGMVTQTLIEIAVALTIVAVTEGAARAIALVRPAETWARLGDFARGVARMLGPIVGIGGAIESVVDAVLPPPAPDDEERETSAEQFREVVAAEAEISSREEELIHGVFSLGNTEVHEIMVPRVDIVGIDSATPWSEVVDRVRSSEHARVPVFDDTIDNIVGILYAKDLLLDVLAVDEPGDSWHRLIRPAAFIPTSKRIDAQLREFQASRTHIAVVTDEYGGTAGLITIENILEEIVGDIRDEYDVEAPDIEQEGDRYWVAGRVSLEELSERLGAEFEVEDVTTVGGLVYELFGRVPTPGEAANRGGYRIVVEKVKGRRIERVYFERAGNPVAAEES